MVKAAVGNGSESGPEVEGGSLAGQRWFGARARTCCDMGLRRAVELKAGMQSVEGTLHVQTRRVGLDSTGSLQAESDCCCHRVSYGARAAQHSLSTFCYGQQSISPYFSHSPDR